MRRLNVRQAVTRRDRINRNVEKLKYKHATQPEPNVTPKTTFPLSFEAVWPGSGFSKPLVKL